MPGVQNGEWLQIINKLNAYIAKHAPQKMVGLIQEFSDRYYLSSSVEDLSSRSIKSLYEQVLSHWDFIYEREAKQIKVKVFNPPK